AFTLSVVHVEGEDEKARVVQDVGKAWQSSRNATVDLEGTVRAAAEILRRYRCAEVVSDRYSAGWAKQAWERAGIKVVAPEADRSGTYMAAEPLFAQGLISILDDEVQVRELRNLEKRPRPGGKVSVDHPRGLHDDRANALCLAAARAMDQ